MGRGPRERRRARWTSGAPLTAAAADAPLETWGFYEPNGLIGGDEDVLAYSLAEGGLVDLPANAATHVACAAEAAGCVFVDDGLFVCPRGGCDSLAMPRASAEAALRAALELRGIASIEVAATDSACEGDWVFDVDGFVPLPIVGAWAPGQAAYDSTPKCLALANEGLTAVACTTSRPALCEVNGVENVQGCVRAGALWFCSANRGFASATSFCTNRGGRLAQLTSAGTFADAENMIGVLSATSVWVGGSNGDGGEFTWLDGAPITAQLTADAP